MAGFIAVKLCPQLVLIPPNFKKYQSVSSLIRNTLEKYDTSLEMMSLDEGFLDITNYLKSSSSSVDEIVQQIRKDIYDVSGLTASAGASSAKYVSKICSDLNKPNGQFCLNPDSTLDFVFGLSIRKFPGIGKVTEQILNAIGIELGKDLVILNFDISFICDMFCINL
jgi:DNA polymerase kappa